jgi:uncharacterized protein
MSAPRTFLVHCLDAEGAAPHRAAARPAHSARLAAQRAEPGEVALLVYGPLVADDGTTPVGSAFLVAAPSRAAVSAWVEADPFRTGGVWGAVQVHELAVSANAPVRLDVERSTP